MKSRRAHWILGSLIAVCVAGPLSAQDPATVDRLAAEMELWLNYNDVSRGALAITYQGQPVDTRGFGMDADTPVELASLSKAITSICAHTLVLDGLLSWNDSVQAFVPDAPEGITLGDLVSHSSGLATDSTQGNIYMWLNSSEDFAPQVISRINARGGAQGARGEYVYNNENHALLGLAIDALSDASLEDTCATRALQPAGVTGQRSPKTGAFLSFGGWQMTVADYARFHAHWFGAKGAIGQDPFSAPHTDMGGGAYYGLGMTFRAFREDHNFWHFGLWCFPGRLNTGSYVVSWEGDWGAVAAFDGCHDWPTLIALDNGLTRAVYTP
jgi:CubicO group peptidase (beta-lactamase class C family)